MIFVVYFVLCILAGVYASSKDKSFMLWCFLSVIISPLLTFLFLLVMGEDSKVCPKCAEKVKPEALVCKHCSHAFEAAPAQEYY